MISVPASLLDRLESAPYGAYAIDLEQTIVFWNSQAERILGYTAQDVLGRKCYDVAQGIRNDGITPLCSQDCPAVAAARHGRIPPAAQVRIRCASGEWKRITVIPLIATDDADEVVLVHMFHETPPNDLGSDPPAELPLTSRELEILRLLSSGLRPADIAEQLFISVHTVRKHISNACEKLHSHGMMSAVMAAQRQHLL